MQRQGLSFEMPVESKDYQYRSINFYQVQTTNNSWEGGGGSFACVSQSSHQAGHEANEYGKEETSMGKKIFPPPPNRGSNRGRVEGEVNESRKQETDPEPGSELA